MPVYFIQAGENGAVKIGWADNPERRLSSLQCGQPIPLRLLRVLPTANRAAENVLQHRFKKSHIRGEWYRFDPEMLVVDTPPGGGPTTFRLALKNLQIRQNHFAEMTGYRIDTVSRWATGSRHVPIHVMHLVDQIDPVTRIIPHKSSIMPQSLGESLLLARRRAGVSQAALAGIMGISPAFLSMIEKERKRFPLERLDRLPQDIRAVVVDALVAEKEQEIAVLRAEVAQ